MPFKAASASAAAFAHVIDDHQPMLRANDEGQQSFRLNDESFLQAVLRSGQRQLLDQARRALRPLPVDLMPQLGNLQLLLGDQRLVFRGFRAGDRELRYNL